MIPKATQSDTDQDVKGSSLKPIDVEAEKVEAKTEAVPGSFVAALSPELRAMFEAGWANNESAYRKLAR